MPSECLCVDVRIRQIRWCLLIIDCLTRMIFLKELHLSDSLSTTLKDKNAADDESVTRRPASKQVWQHFNTFMTKLNKTRRHHAERTGVAYDGDLHVKQLTTDKGSEDALFPQKFKELAAKHYTAACIPFSLLAGQPAWRGESFAELSKKPALIRAGARRG